MKLAVSSGTLFNMATGHYDYDQTAINQAAILLDDGSIYGHVDPAAFEKGQMTHAGPDTLKPTDIAVAPSGIYALATNDYIYRYDIGATPEQGRWVKSPDAKDVVAISSDAEGRIWCVNKKGELYHSEYNRMELDPGNWQKVDAVNIAGALAAGPKQTVKELAVNSSRKLDLSTGQYFGPFGHAVAILTNKGHIYFDYNADTAPTGHGYADSMFHAHGEPANVVDIALGRAPFAYDTAGNVYFYMQRGESGDWIKDKDAKDVIGISNDSDGGIWVLNKKGEVYRAMPELGGGLGSWTRVPAASTAGFWNTTWEYTVKPRDGLYQIIRINYGVTDTPTLKRISDEVVRLNRLANENQISAGQVLTMPAKTYR